MKGATRNAHLDGADAWGPRVSEDLSLMVCVQIFGLQSSFELFGHYKESVTKRQSILRIVVDEAPNLVLPPECSP